MLTLSSSFSSGFAQPTLKKRNELIDIITVSTIVCPYLSTLKQWTIYKIENQTEKQIQLQNNPTINYDELVLQPSTLDYGLFRVYYTFTMLYSDHQSVTSSLEAFIQIIPSGLVLSTLKLSQPMYGGQIEIFRGLNQKIEFNPFLFTYDIDSIAVITSLTFKYACQIKDSNIPSGYPQMLSTNQMVYLDDIKQNPFLKYLDQCFNSSSDNFNFN
jgi:hypothetical protein